MVFIEQVFVRFRPLEYPCSSVPSDTNTAIYDICLALTHFFSIKLTDKIDNSYKIKRGIAKPIWVIGSGGVKIAAAAKIITTTYFLLVLKNSESTTPTLASKLSTTGN